MTTDKGSLALVTGASSGIGLEFARAMAARGLNVLVVARREERLLDLKAELEQQYGVQIFPFVADLAEEGVERHVVDEVDRIGLPLAWLINNAGYAIEGPFDEIPLVEHQKFMKVMMTGLLELTHRLIPHLKKATPAYIINVGSMGSFFSCSPQGGVYMPVKKFVQSFSEQLAVEFEMQNIDISVTVSCPGLTKTEIFHSASESAKEAMASNRFVMSAADVVEQSIDAVLNGKVVVVHGWNNKLFAALLRHLPLSWSRWLTKTEAEKMFDMDGEVRNT